MRARFRRDTDAQNERVGRSVARPLDVRSIEADMKIPRTKKNPFLSMWLSGANTVANSARVRTTAAAKRATSAFWSAALTPPKPKKSRKTRR
ncbi:MULTISPECIES: hypothetical protein [unclassified Paraburkholderia]|uniref:hypothetical protein n=1 Tax=unclassified Paraburkholderia TaxID=2615204 RepID=UPI00184DBADB|nr:MULTISPECIES: hypothetical protein [unclassified Paraburkholderia]MBB5447647.1 hypothetical protein [Paraburkholderia sp. WSM4177]MBB5488177.1 hypothetical protein [Paraburkholderia sp. WSM4180]